MVVPPKPPAERKKFSYDNWEETPALEPPAPSSKYAQEKIPRDYECYTGHVDVVSNREGKLPGGAAVIGKAAGWSELTMSWGQPADLYPASYPHFVRGRDSLRGYISKLFTSEISMYDGAMGTMVQKQKWLDEEAFRGERFKDWSCNVKGNNDLLSLTQPQVIKDIYACLLYTSPSPRD